MENLAAQMEIQENLPKVNQRILHTQEEHRLAEIPVFMTRTSSDLSPLEVRIILR